MTERMNSTETDTERIKKLMRGGRSGLGAVLCLCLLCLLAGFSAVTTNVIEIHEFGLSGREQILKTALKVLYFLALFIGMWILMRRVDRHACVEEIERERAGRSLYSEEETVSGNPLKTETENEDRKRKFRGGFLTWNRRSILLCAVLIALAYLPYLVVFYPGVSNYDTANELTDFFNGTYPLPFSWRRGQVEISYFLNDHHPVTDTFLFVFFVRIGLFLGNSNYGVALYSFVQICATAGAFSVMLCSMDKLGVPALWRRIGFFLVLLMPFYGMYAINMIKDSVNAVFFVLYFVEFVFVVRQGATRGRMVRLIVLSLLIALTKKTGVYLCILSNVFLILLRSVRRHWLSWLLSMLIPACVIFVLFAKILFPMFHIYPGGRQEALGIFMQMTERAFRDYPEDVTQEQQEAMDAIVPREWADANYSYDMTDNIKNGYNFYATDVQIRDFLQLWKEKGLQHPDSYVKAVLGVNGGFLVPTDEADIYTIYRPVEHYHVHSNPTRFSTLREVCRQVYEEWLVYMPGTDLLLRICLYAFWIPMLAFARILFEKEWRDLLLLFPIAGSIGVLLIGPAVFFRYALGLAYVAPLLLGLCSTRGLRERGELYLQ